MMRGRWVLMWWWGVGGRKDEGRGKGEGLLSRRTSLRMGRRMREVGKRMTGVTQLGTVLKRAVLAAVASWTAVTVIAVGPSRSKLSPRRNAAQLSSRFCLVGEWTTL